MNITKGFARKAMIFGFALSALMSAALAQAESYNFGKNVSKWPTKAGVRLMMVASTSCLAT